ncbi:hypothetical protein BSL78_05950 [Apostichopus japonicus]|uniref:NXPE C-terminal domain-containing protein n=1 Tax=Stichopus japonicus TaxID=307972 RepID=A0A2G8LA51_STIJA|nr:hypothetical protein BSL78_05950 [Apostichopus japonicus]
MDHGSVKNQHINISPVRIGPTISINQILGKKLQSTLNKQELEVFKSTKVQLNTSSLPLIEVQVGGGSLNHRTALPFCTLSPVPSTIKPSGYFANNSWQPLTCGVKHFDKHQFETCLKGKSVHIYGDSTGRQMYEYLEDNENCDSVMSHEYLKYCVKKNQSIHFGFHGPPVRGSQIISVDKLRYVAEQIDDLEGGPEVIIILSIWAHFGVPDGTFYRDRLQAIKGAVGRLWQRSPETKVIVRSANTREHAIGGFILISSDWIALQGEKTLRGVFSQDKRFSFLDVWDMTLVQQSKDAIHPLKTTLVQIMDYLLTMICL